MRDRETYYSDDARRARIYPPHTYINSSAHSEPADSRARAHVFSARRQSVGAGRSQIPARVEVLANANTRQEDLRKRREIARARARLAFKCHVGVCTCVGARSQERNARGSRPRANHPRGGRATCRTRSRAWIRSHVEEDAHTE